MLHTVLENLVFRSVKNGLIFLKLLYSKKKERPITLQYLVFRPTQKIRTTVVSVWYLLSRRLQQHGSWTNYSASTYYILPQLTATRCLNKLFIFYYISAKVTVTQFVKELFSFCLQYIIICYNNTVPEQNVQLLLTIYDENNTVPEQNVQLLLLYGT